MKNILLTTLMTSTLLISACGKYEKNPVQDLDQMRKQGQSELEKGPDKPQVLTETVVVERPVEVIKEQSTLDQNFVVITPDAEMNFVEGEASTFQVIGRSLLKGVGIQLAAQNLPVGAVFKAAPTAQDANRYILTWTPAFGTVASTSVIKTIKFKISAQITTVPADQDRKKLESLLREKEVSVLVLKNQTPPSELTVDLTNQVNENSESVFQVSVKVPGVDDKSAQKPRLSISYDGVSLTQGNKYLELDGSRHVMINPAQREPLYQGNYKWQYSLIFDTKNISVQPPMDPKGVVQANAETAHVRLSFKVYSPMGSSTPEISKQLEIVLSKPVSAPRFDLSGLTEDSLELTQGETVKLSFTISSADTNAVVKVELPNVKTLVGAPTMTCQASVLGSFKQDCSFTWKVPCTATDAELTQGLTMTAITTAAGRSSEPVPYTLKTVRSVKEKVNCTVGGAK